MAAHEGGKKPRSVVATDSDWRTIRSRIGRANMTAFLVSCALAPVEPAVAEDLAVMRWVDRHILVLVEQMRFEVEGRVGAWQRVVKEAEASVAADAGEG